MKGDYVKRIKTATHKHEIFIIPTFGFLKAKEYRGLYWERWCWKLCFAWMIWGAAIKIWSESEWRETENY